MSRTYVKTVAGKRVNATPPGVRRYRPTHLAFDVDEDGNRFIPAPDYRGRAHVVRDYAEVIKPIRRRLERANRYADRQVDKQKVLAEIARMEREGKWWFRLGRWFKKLVGP